VHVVGYLRVSTDEQARSGLGLEDQRQRIDQELKRREWSVTWVVDDGYSASTLTRPGIAGALEDLRSGRADALVVSKLDRLSRSLIDFASLMDSAKREGWALIALDLGVDMTTAAGEMMANVMASFAQYERRLIGQRTKDALAVLKSQGRRLGRPVAVSPSTAADIGQWRAAGVSYQGCADALNAAGVPTAHGGRRWYASTVRSVEGSLSLDAKAAAASAHPSAHAGRAF
jgi:DNA invertase Pin-like site-specific DNA recombinase